MAIYGIDLGTTYSCIAYIDESGRPVIVKSAIGEDTTPSVVYFESPESVVVGRAAKNTAVIAPNLVVQLIKRQMGQDISFDFHGKSMRPEAISALILRELARTAEEQTGEVVQDVVVTVPAYFGVAEREATRTAGQIAGLNVLDVIAEPVAAALHYQALNAADQVRHILVYDLGGGTFDTTVIRLDGDDVQVVCTDGDHHLGGADWDDKIIDFLLTSFTRAHPDLDPSGDEQFMQELASAAEQLKRELSSTQSRRHNMRFGGATVQVELSRAQLEELTSELLERTVKITERTIETAREKGVENFDDVLLVGGMTRMPIIAQSLKDRIGYQAKLHEPDLAVAKGAAAFALIQKIKVSLPADIDGAPLVSPLAAEDIADQLGITVAQVEQMAAKRIATVVPRAFGLKVTDTNDPVFRADPSRAREYVSHLLTANTPLPADAGPDTFCTVADNQRAVDLEVWEQAGSVASPELADNTFVGMGRLTDLPPRPAGTPFQVTFHMSEMGLLQVHAVEASSGNEVRFELQIGGLAPSQVDSAAAAVARFEVSG